MGGVEPPKQPTMMEARTPVESWKRLPEVYKFPDGAQPSRSSSFESFWTDAYQLHTMFVDMDSCASATNHVCSTRDLARVRQGQFVKDKSFF